MCCIQHCCPTPDLRSVRVQHAFYNFDIATLDVPTCQGLSSLQRQQRHGSRLGARGGAEPEAAAASPVTTDEVD